MNYSRYTFFLFLLIVVASNPGRLSAETVPVQILHTADIHGQISIRTDRDGEEGGERAGSFLQLANLIAKQRNNFGRDRTLLIDTGDTIQGTWSSAHDQGESIIQLLNILRYDVWAIGNHELDYGIRRLEEIYSQNQGIILAGNLKLEHAGAWEQLPAWRLFKRGGARIVVIGATAGFLRNWFCPEKYTGFKVEKARSMLRRIMPEVLRIEPDMIILALHQGWQPNDVRGVNEVIDIVREFPEIDLVLGGHTHWTLPGRKIAPHTWYVQPGKHAEYLGIIEADIDIEKGETTDIRSYLEPVDSAVQEHQAAWKAVEAAIGKAEQRGSEIIGRAATDISSEGTPGIDCQTSELIARAIADATDSDIVLHGKLSGQGLSEGIIERKDIFSIVPYENGVLTCQLPAEELKIIIEEQLNECDSSAFSAPWGIKAEINGKGKVASLRTPAGDKLQASRTYKVALNSYTAAGGGGRFPRLRRILNEPSSETEDTGLMTRAVVMKYIEEEKIIKDIKCRRWLSGSFYQQ